MELHDSHTFSYTLGKETATHKHCQEHAEAIAQICELSENISMESLHTKCKVTEQASLQRSCRGLLLGTAGKNKEHGVQQAKTDMENSGTIDQHQWKPSTKARASKP